MTKDVNSWKSPPLTFSRFISNLQLNDSYPPTSTASANSPDFPKSSRFLRFCFFSQTPRTSLSHRRDCSAGNHCHCFVKNYPAALAAKNFTSEFSIHIFLKLGRAERCRRPLSKVLFNPKNSVLGNFGRVAGDHASRAISKVFDITCFSVICCLLGFNVGP